MAASDLTTLAAVRAYLQFTDAADTSQDPILEQLITRMSTVISRHCHREFAPPVNAVARTIELDRRDRLQTLSPFDCRAATSITLDQGLTGQRVLDRAEWELALLDTEHGVWGAIELIYPVLVWPGGRTLTITGDWGFNEVPGDVDEACVEAVVTAVRGGVQGFGSSIQPNSFGPDVNAGNALPAGIRGKLKPFVRDFYR